MSNSGTLVVISCNETDPRIDPSRYFNLSTNNTQSIKTLGGRTQPAINNIYYIDQASRIGLITVVQHTTCTSSSTDDIDTTIRSDIQLLKDSPYVRNEIPIIGYALDTGTGQLREVKYVVKSPCSVFQNPVMPLIWHASERGRMSVLRNGNGAGEEVKRRVLSEMEDFGPFFS